MKYLLNILILSLIFVSCKENTDLSPVSAKSGFNLKTDLYDFKKKMNDSDTLKIWFDHSVCLFQGYERIEITKFLDSIKIRSEFKEELFPEESDWKSIYEKKISVGDSLWKFERFLVRNNFRLNSDENEYVRLQISHGKTKVNYFTTDLVDLNRFLKDYYQTMQILYPENVYSIYGFIDFE